MFLARTVAGFTTVVLPAAPRIAFYGVVRSLLKFIEDLFVAGLAGLRAGVARRPCRWRWSSGCREACGPSEERGTRNRIEETTPSISGHEPNYSAWTLLGAKSAPAEWQALQLSPYCVVLAVVCDAVVLSLWQPMHAAVVAGELG